MHERKDKRYAPPLSIAEETVHTVGGQYLAVASSLSPRQAFAWFGAAWALFRQRAGWWFGLVLVWTILSYILAAAMQAFIPSVIPFFPAVRDFAAVFATAGAAYAAERVEQQARIDWRASLVVLVRCAGALVLGVAVALTQPTLTMIETIDAVPPVWMMRVVSLVNNMVGLLLMLALYAACRDIFFKRDIRVEQAT